MDSTTLLQLPDELILMFMHKLPDFPQDRQKEWVTLSKINRRLRALAIEQLLLRPVVHIARARKLIETYMRYPTIVSRVQVLEFHPSSLDLNLQTARRLSTAYTDVPDDRCSKLYNRIIDESAVQYKQIWHEDLASGDPNAYLAILLSMLPNLNSLLLAANFNDYF
jgi:hypothetical protein